MIELAFSPEAVTDLQQTKTYIAEELCSETAAQHTIERIIKRIRTLSEFPEIGSPLSAVVGFDTEYRYLVCNNYTAFYRYEQSRVMIVRILYCRRDYMRILFDPDAEQKGFFSYSESITGLDEMEESGMMGERVWKRAQSIGLDVADTIEPEISVCFDKKIPKEMQHELHSFVRWLETNYRFPITLWVDFEYRHYLVTREGKRVGYLFYWADFVNYPVFQNFNDIPMIRLPVRTEHSTVEEILFSFLEAITDYYAWLCNEPIVINDLDEKDAEAVLMKYMTARDSGEWRFIG